MLADTLAGSTAALDQVAQTVQPDDSANDEGNRGRGHDHGNQGDQGQGQGQGNQGNHKGHGN